MSWIGVSWKGKMVRWIHNQYEGTGIIICDNSPSRPAHVHRYVDVLWSTGVIEEEIHTSDLEVIDERG